MGNQREGGHKDGGRFDAGRAWCYLHSNANECLIDKSKVDDEHKGPPDQTLGNTVLSCMN